MSVSKMHENEVPTDVALVRRLLAGQFPQWADLPIQPVPSAGTDNALYRLGSKMVVRLPRIDWAIGQIEKEQRWLPVLAPHLPLPIPVPLAVGEPAEGYPWEWAVYPWMAGENVTIEDVGDPAQFVKDLARFTAALHQIDTAGGPLAGAPNFSRGVPLAARDESTRATIAKCGDLVDAEAVTAAWEVDLNAPVWDRSPVWIHGDLQAGNLLAVDGRLSAIIDFGCLAVGDPACDLQVAWNFLTPDTREMFRAALGVDDATWARGRGWALSLGLGALPYYQHTNPYLAGLSRYAIDQVLADHARGATR